MKYRFQGQQYSNGRIETKKETIDSRPYIKGRDKIVDELVNSQRTLIDSLARVMRLKCDHSNLIEISLEYRK